MLFKKTMSSELRQEMLHFSNQFEQNEGRNIQPDIRQLIVDEYTKKADSNEANVIIVNELPDLSIEEQVVAVYGYYSSETETLQKFSHFLWSLYERHPFIARFCDFNCREMLALNEALDAFQQLMNGGISPEKEGFILEYMDSVPRIMTHMRVRFAGVIIVLMWLAFFAGCIISRLV
ncbi:MAG: hypothetical protein J5966_02020 [Lachnospiraceae bacterium]|nr:hypothetical protein [Lachnospiraceae bacterium]